MNSPVLSTNMDAEQQKNLSVTELVQMSNEHLKQLWKHPVSVVGELSNVRSYASGHIYLTLKDSSAEISGVMFASYAANLTTDPKEGDAVVVRCQPTIYPPKGRFQIVISHIEQRGGQGQLYEEFLRIKEDLRDKGWFAETHKKQIPKFPRRIGVVVSQQGAAKRDVCITLRKRFPLATVIIFPAPAQGHDAPAKISVAINSAGSENCDVLLVCRGGGSFEDLHAYNDIQVAKAIYASEIPIITGVGHQTDETIADFVADLRAPTPTGAAVAAVPDREELLQRVADLAQRCRKACFEKINFAGERIDDCIQDLRTVAQQQAQISRLRMGILLQARQRLLAYVRSMQNYVQRIDQLTASLLKVRRQLCKHHTGQLNHLQQRLDSLDPRRTLQRGYAILTDAHGKVLSYADQLPAGTAAVLELQDGAVDTVVGEKTTSKLRLSDDLSTSS